MEAYAGESKEEEHHETSPRDKLGDATHAGTHATIAEEDSVGFWPVRLTQRHSLGIKEG